MKKGIILNLRWFKLRDYVTLNKIFLLLTLLFVLGIILGSTWLSDNSWITNFSRSTFEKFIDVHSTAGFFNKFFNCFLRYITILFLYFLTGTLMLGVAIIPFITIWQGIAIGNITSYIYCHHGISGIAFNAIILITPLSIFVICCLLAAKKSINFSLNIAKLTLPKSRPLSLNTAFKEYCTKYIILVAITIICILIEIILNVLFLKFFNFY